jgi:hypothetical protein
MGDPGCITLTRISGALKREPQERPDTRIHFTEWLGRHPRWSCHFAPTSASRLGAVEGFFGIVKRRQRHAFKDDIQHRTAHRGHPAVICLGLCRHVFQPLSMLKSSSHSDAS